MDISLMELAQCYCAFFWVGGKVALYLHLKARDLTDPQGNPCLCRLIDFI